MLRVLVGCLLSVLAASSALAQKLEPGLVITKNASIKKAVYNLPNSAEDPFTGVITIRGENLTVDFHGATLQGTPENTPPDERKGTGIAVVGHNITIKNVKVRGYKVGLVANGVSGLKILDSDFSYNWKQHLKSGLEKENEDDWQYYHHNEKDEWFRYGAGIYLKGCEDFEVKHCQATGGQCGLMLVQSNKGLIWNNEFAFLSGIGIGLYRSSDNKIMHNSLDWCVRGFSYGYYSRGQDSAALLLYEQSNRNLIAYNSATHGGDGFFLWAGQTTMDTGEGGCNDNVVYGNDFSYAPANGIEATFSRNVFANNFARECDYGVWGGYSYDSKILGNWFIDNRRGVAIEHGQNNVIRGNFFTQNNTGIMLWANPNEDPDWGYPKHRDTKSRDYEISGNVMSRADLGLDIRNSANVAVTGNTFQLLTQVLKKTGDNPGLKFSGNRLAGMSNLGADITAGNEVSTEIKAGIAPEWDPFAEAKDYPAEVRGMRPEKLKGGQNPFLPEGSIRGRYNIIVDEWGPYDFAYPKLWPEPMPKQGAEESADKDHPMIQKFRLLGPPGKWKLVGSAGVENVSPKEGEVPDELTVSLPSGHSIDLNLQIEYTGDFETVDYLGIKHKAGDKITIGYSKFFVSIPWNVQIYAWDEKTDPRSQEAAFRKLLTGKPVAQKSVDRLQFGTSGFFLPGAPADKFATVAQGSVELPDGNYSLEVTSDDGCRVWVNGSKVIDEWHYQGPTTFKVPLKGGKQDIRIEHFEIDGNATLQAEIRKT